MLFVGVFNCSRNAARQGPLGKGGGEGKGGKGGPEGPLGKGRALKGCIAHTYKAKWNTKQPTRPKYHPVSYCDFM